jgi:methyl-accepting chemotaxis protein
MKFSTKIMWGALVPATLFVVALVTAMLALNATHRAFQNFTNTDMVVERGLNNLYAQGLQMEQAIRNTYLDPDNPKAFDNFKSAQAIYDKVYAQTSAAAAATPLAQGVQAIAPLREKHAQAQAKVMAVIRDKEQVITLLNAEETPAWRALKDQLLAQIKAASANADKAHEAVDASVDRGLWIGIAMGLLAATVATAAALLIQRTVRMELGGDPAQARAALTAIAQGQLNVALHNQGGSASLMATLEQMEGTLKILVRSVHDGADSIASASAEIAQGDQDLSARTESQASALQQTSAAMMELAGTVQRNAENAAQANQLAQSASSVAVQGGDVVAQVVDTMRSINEASRKIADIISVIDGIAFQTNILALNAAVEAARAGEQGRGFAVVASEVRALAGRSADAAKEIKALIGTSVDRVDQGTALVDKAGATMQEVVSSIKRVTDIVGEISAASREQSQGVAQVGEAVQQMDVTTQQNAALVEQIAAAAASLKSQAQELVKTVAVFVLDDGATPFAYAPPPPAPARPPAPAPRKPAPLASARAAPRLPPQPQAPRKPLAGAKASAASAKPAPLPAPAKASNATSDEEWETF